MKKRGGMLVAVFAILIVAVVFGAKLVPDKDGTNASEPNVEEIATAAGDTAAQALPTMLELGSKGCIPCEQMKPVMAELTEAHGSLIKIEFHDVRENRAIAQQYKIRLIPTQIFLTAEGKEFFRHEGFFPRKEIEKVFRDMGVPL